MKLARWLMLLLVSSSLFGVACFSAEPEVEETEPTEEVSPDDMGGGDMEETQEEAEETEAE